MKLLTVKGTVIDGKQPVAELLDLYDFAEVAVEVEALDAAVLPVGHTHQAAVLGCRYTVWNGKRARRWGH